MNFNLNSPFAESLEQAPPKMTRCFYLAVHPEVFAVFSIMNITVQAFRKRFASILNASNNPAHIYLFKVNNRNTRKTCEIWLKLTIKQQNDIGVFIVNFEHISHLFLLFLLLTLNTGRTS